MDAKTKKVSSPAELDRIRQKPGVEKRPRVLITDDETNIRQALWHILKKEFDVTTVENGEKAIEQIRKDPDIDVVSLDIEMPGMSGIDTLQAIKKERPDVEVLVVTGHAELESAKKALKFGAYDYIDKPFSKEVIRAAVRKAAERRQKVIVSEVAKEKLAFVKAQLLQSEKFKAIGEMLAGVVHELNNPLGAVLGYSELLLGKDLEPEKARKFIENISTSAKLCKNIVDKLLAFARKHEPKREPVQINEVIESTLDLKQHDIKVNGIQLVKELADNMPCTSADFHALQQVFFNLINNAQHAMHEGDGEKRLTIQSEFDDKILRIKFNDTGHGIPEENLSKIFEPLFTTKEEGKGTGLGLSICYDIIKEHKGEIFVASEPGDGTWFIVELPIQEPAVPSSPGPEDENRTEDP